MQDMDPRHRDDVDAIGWPDDGFSDDLGHGEAANDTGAPDEATRELSSKELPGLDSRLSPEERDRLVLLRAGARLRQGSTYLDLARLDDGPFVAMGGRHAGPHEHLVSKAAIDYETWNRLAGDREPRLERPEEA